MSLRIGDEVPDFTAETTEGTIRFHEWIGDGWIKEAFDQLAETTQDRTRAMAH